MEKILFPFVLTGIALAVLIVRQWRGPWMPPLAST